MEITFKQSSNSEYVAALWLYNKLVYSLWRHTQPLHIFDYGTLVFICGYIWKACEHSCDASFGKMPHPWLKTHLQADGTWRSGESSGSLISLLTEHALLSSGTRLSITTLWERDTAEFSTQYL